ncbi:LacI family DNA-binding transcriptional regulator [Agromyces seonyuensis]|uniref:LacI family DNA-binding transcriptional regulator n=1 Tax=Agromyces seonyuensis TaxID=2662446 RepID=A0A6I4NVR5_9MICO|nr:LacI family DNA-binding transcriptional regulator [Agromyces seonyuensis]MWB97202.1 LacI family DNA-binding transcriptional regulator [Agromyces seonyuensis]
MAAKRVTMKDVARASGVSASTVSFVLNDAPGQTIPDATRERVRRAAAELGYVPHGLARALREGSSRIVVLNVARLPRDGVALAGFIGGLSDELAEHGHTLLVRYRDAPDDADPVLAAISPRAVLDLDRVYFDDEPELADGGWVDGLAAHTAVQLRHLVGAGHRSIAFALRGDERLSRLGALRFDYARDAAAEAGLPALVPVAVGHPAAAHDRDALAALLAEHPEITAVAGVDDEAAMRVLAAARALGLAVPDRLAVIGFDETPFAELAEPPLTTVRIDTAAFGRRAARELLGLPAATDDRGSASLAATVIRRESA